MQLETSELSANAFDQLRTALLKRDPEPDLRDFESLGHETLGLSAENVRSLIYEVALRANLSLFPPLTHLEVIHTEGCNLACTYCFEKNMLGYRTMPVEVARAAVDLFFDYSADHPSLEITHFGGEPTLNFEGIRFTTEYAERKARVSGKTLRFDMTTNGILLNDSMVAYFAEHEIQVLLSIDGLEGSHDRFRVDRGGGGTFKRVVKGLEVLKRKQAWVGTKMTVMPENVASLFDDVLGLYQFGINHFIIGHATGIDWPQDAFAEYGRQLSRLHSWYSENHPSDLRIEGFDDGASESYFGCQAGRNSIAITIAGEVSPCSKIMGFDSRRLISKLGDVTRGLIYIRNRQDLVTCSPLQAACEQHGLANEFRGGCFAVNYGENVDIFQPSKQEHAFSILRRSACAGCGCS